MAFRRNHAMTPLAHRQGDELRILVERFGGDAQIRLAADHPFGNLRWAALMQFELDRWVLRNKIAHHQRQRVTRLGVRCGQNQPTGVTGGKFRARPFEIFSSVTPVKRLPLRSKIEIPNSSSSNFTCLEIPGCEVNSVSAASETLSP
jgi:hypothetical protein